jgi:hypothetical protein
VYTYIAGAKVPDDDMAGANTYVLHGVPDADDCHVLLYGCDGDEQNRECRGVFNTIEGNPILPFLPESLLLSVLLLLLLILLSLLLCHDSIFEVEVEVENDDE